MRQKDRLIGEPHKQWMAMLDAIGDFIFITDEEGKIVRTNRALAIAFGKHPRDIIGTSTRDLFDVEVTLGENPQREGVRLPLTIERTVNSETYLISSFPLHGDEKVLTVHVMKNITEMERVKEQLFYSYKLASLGLLVSGVAHEINNPLTGIIAYGEILRMKGFDEETDRELGKILESAERCRKIVDNLLTFARQRTPTKTLESINEIIDRTIELRNYSLKMHGIEVVRDYKADQSVFVDAQQILQLILNVLINAEHAVISRNNSGGKIIFTTRTDREARKVIAKVQDNGPGIPKAIINRIFDPFFTTKPVGIGTGLGLSISYGIIVEHGGSLKVESAEGGGPPLSLRYR